MYNKKNKIKAILIISIAIIFLLFLISFSFSGCCVSWNIFSDLVKGGIKSSLSSSTSASDISEREIADSIDETETTKLSKFRIYIEEKIPKDYKYLIIQKLREILQEGYADSYEFIDNKDEADFIFTIENCYDSEQSLYESIFYVPVTSFYSMIEDISWQDFKDLWNGNKKGFKDIKGNEVEMKIVISQGVLNILEKMLGKCRTKSIEVVKNYEILSVIEGEGTTKDEEKTESISIIPFDNLRPEFKVLTLDDVSVLDKNMENTGYPLAFKIRVESKNNGIPEDIKNKVIDYFEDSSFSNRSPDEIVTIIMTGVTALTRQIAARMDTNGILYPSEKIVDVLLNADITHISNEVSFVEDCYAAKPNTMIFCSKPEYIELIKYIGADVIELTGNHLNDYGTDWLLYTINIYDKEGIPYFGGGRNLEDSCRPALFEINGYKFAFVGANSFGPSSDWATEQSAGSAPINAGDEIQKEIDMQKFENIIKDLKSRGYNVIFTFQYLETYNYFPTEQQVKDFERIVNAGATIVSGSQAHQPQGIEILDNGFINFGLGNLFFGQALGLSVKQGIIAKHVFYKGRHISTILITTLIEDLSQPRPTSGLDRAELLQSIFSGSKR